LGDDHLQAEPGQGVLVVSDQVLAVALVAPLVVVGAGVDVVAVTPGECLDRPRGGDSGRCTRAQTDLTWQGAMESRSATLQVAGEFQRCSKCSADDFTQRAVRGKMP
jgi:hypothetical protein